MNKSTIKKLSEIYKLGHLPCRGDQLYDKTFRLANCFEHACLNLTDQEIEQYCITENDSCEFGNFYSITQKGTSLEIERTLKKTGLQIEKCTPDKVINFNQWKVALYFEYFYTLNRDFHFLIQEKDGSWSGKIGYTSKCHHFKNLPESVCCDKRYYNLYETFCITNPYATKEKEHSIE